MVRLPRSAVSLLRRGIAISAFSAVLVPALAPAASAATLPSVSAMSPEHFLELVRQTRTQVQQEEAEQGQDIEQPPVVFATVAGQQLVLPGEVRKVGFHESGDRRALAMSPVGRLDVNLNAERIALPPVNGEPDADYLVLPTRQRVTGPTTAVDISMTHGEPVASVVTGTVTAVGDYTLYGTTPDQVVEIVPDDRPELAVRMLHIEGVQVAVGARVEAGETLVAASARKLPFDSQIDRHAGSHPHVHLEVQHRS